MPAKAHKRPKIRGERSPTLEERGDAAAESGWLTEAARLFERAVAAAPGDHALRQRCAALLLDTDRAAEAIPHLEHLHRADPENVSWRRMLAVACARTGDYGRAAALYPRLVEQEPENAKLWLAYASALRHTGRRAESGAACREAIARAPELGEAYLAIQDVTGGGLTDADLAAIAGQLARPDLAISARAHLHYAMGRALERRDAAASWSHYARGAKFRRMTIKYDADANTAQVSHLARFFDADFFRARAGWGHPDPSPVFILGMPRSGSTLLEHALAAHSIVEGTLELPELPHVVRSLVDGLAKGNSGEYPDCLARAAPADIAAAGAEYIERTNRYRRLGRPYFTDKLLLNWMHVGLIHLILPNAVIIDARRAPAATCFSAFKQDFGQGQRFSYDLVELGRYYNDYIRLMDHYDRVLPGRVLRVRYEDVVDDFEGQVRRMLDHIGVAFEPACLSFWRLDRAVSTSSSEQVRRPLYRDSLEEWRRFEGWLGPLLQTLEDKQAEG